MIAVAIALILASYWSSTETPLPNGDVVIRWQWKGNPTGIGLYQRDGNGNLLGQWHYLDKVDAAAVARGEWSAIEKGWPDYVSRK